ncbi:MAG: TRAP transporter small permease [Planctomycetes bacterium]|nr:TRAP transporter small permease [Planctomycetota bacterium]
MKNDKKIFNLALRVLNSLDLFVSGIIIAAMFVTVMLQVLTRIMPIRALSWTNEMGELLLMCLIWIGISAAVKSNNHIGFDLFVSRLSKTGKKWMGVVNMGLFMVYLIILGYLTWGTMQLHLRRPVVTPMLQIHMYWVRMPMVVGCVLGVIQLLLKEYRIITGRERMYESSVHLGE